MKAYCTSDKIGSQTGGGVVTYNELRALKLLDVSENVDVINPSSNVDPFVADTEALQQCKSYNLAHFYAGTYSKTIKYLKTKGTKISYTAAAHDIKLSQEEYAKLGVPFNYPHLINKQLFDKYVEGYLEADLVICPSTHSKKVMESYGCKNIEVIPHGCHIPEQETPLPKSFKVGFLSSPGPDKGLIYLIQAWAKLRYNDTTLIIAGRGTESYFPLVREHGKGAIQIRGFVKDVKSFYNSISLLVVPSVSEGFNIEVLEAMSYGRPVICSEGAGAADCAVGTITPIRNVDAIAEAINCYKNNPDKLTADGKLAREKSKDYTWDNIHLKYLKAWKNV